MIQIRKLNEIYLKLVCEKAIALEIYDKFSFFVNGYKFMPTFRNGMWDGMIHMLSLKGYTFPVGLIFDLIRYFKENDYSFELDKSLNLVKLKEPLDEFLERVLPTLKMTPYDYQLETLKKIVQLNRSFVLSPTGSREKFHHLSLG
jgi:hypothetical protein